MRADQELDETLAHVGRWRLTWMNTCCYDDNLSLFIGRRVGRLLELRVTNGQQVQSSLLLKIGMKHESGEPSSVYLVD